MSALKLRTVFRSISTQAFVTEVPLFDKSKSLKVQKVEANKINKRIEFKNKI